MPRKIRRDTRILIADDNDIRRDKLRGTLLDVGFSSRGVAVGQGGHLAVEATPCKQPDIIFLAIDLPNLDGIMALSVIRHLHPDIPIVALTAKENIAYLGYVQQIDVSHILPYDASVFELRSAITSPPPPVRQRWQYQAPRAMSNSQIQATALNVSEEKAASDLAAILYGMAA